MNKDEAEKTKSAINGLLQAMGGNALDDFSMGFWMAALKPKPYVFVRQALVDWGNTQKYQPRPSEILSAVETLEAKARADRLKAEEEKAKPKAAPEEVHEVDVAAVLLKAIEEVQGKSSRGGSYYKEKAERWLETGKNDMGEDLWPCQKWWATCVVEGK